MATLHIDAQTAIACFRIMRRDGAYRLMHVAYYSIKIDPRFANMDPSRWPPFARSPPAGRYG